MGRGEMAPSLPPASTLVAGGSASGFPELAGVAAILSTSGTTAAPKGVMLTHAGLLRLAASCARRQGIAPGQRFYSVGPFFHCSGYMHALLANLVAGGTLYSTDGFRPQEAWDVITGEEITLYHGSIVPLQEMALLPQFNPQHLARFNRAWYSAPAVEMARLEALFGTRMCEVYGLTETGGNVAICTATDPTDMRHDSDGRPQDGIEVKIIDPATGESLPEHEGGEICVRGWNVMRGYFRDSEATQRAIDGEGWLHTGDQGVRLPDGFIKFLSRLKDVIRVGGENLSPLEVEEVLMAHPAVREAAVVAAPHPRLGEVPAAFVVPVAKNAIDIDDLRDHCRRQLANFKVPTRFFVVDDLPRSSAVQGRVAKVRLREMIAEMSL
jgi:acyl-CoA synthetase (AMP-forming)/AMP-acid ligase II